MNYSQPTCQHEIRHKNYYTLRLSTNVNFIYHQKALLYRIDSPKVLNNLKNSNPFVLCLLLFSLLCYSTAVSAQDLDYVISNTNYLDVVDGKMKKGNILIADGHIKAISSRMRYSDDMKVINGEGKFVIPGMVDAHIHIFQSGGLYTRPDVIDLRDIRDYDDERQWLTDQADDLLKRYLRCGITTVIDVGGPMANFKIRDRIHNSINHPNLFLTGPLISTYQPPEFDIEDAPIIKVNSSEEARELVRKQIPFKPDFIKIWYISLPQQSAESTYDIVEATIDESHKNGIKVAVHATELNTAKLALRAGADILVHSVDNEVDDDFIRLLKENNATYIPTLMVHRKYVEALGQTYTPTHEDFLFANPTTLGSMFDGQHLINHEQVKLYATYAPQLKVQSESQEKQRELNLKTLQENNINIATGTDAGNIGTHHASSFYEEIEDMKKAGLSNLEILQASSINAARALGKENDFGTIKEGLSADLVLLNNNPLEDLNALKEINLVVKGGHVINPDTLIPITAEQLAQQQLNAYNAQDIDAFLAPYSDSVKVYNYPNDFRYQGIENMRSGYATFFDKNPDLHCELINRMVLGNTVIDQEHVTGSAEGWDLKAIAIYKIAHGKIQEVRFLR